MKLSLCLPGVALALVAAQTCASAFPIAGNSGAVQFAGGVAYDGTNYMVAFQSGTTISAQLFSPAGALMGKAIEVGSSAAFPQNQLTRSLPPAAIAYGAGAYLEVWSDTALASGVDLFGRRIALTGTTIGSAFPLLGSVGGHGPQAIRGIAWSGANFLVVWQDSANENMFGQLLDPGGALSGSEFLISDQASNSLVGAVAFGQTNYLVVWESYIGDWAAFGALVSLTGSAGSPFQISQNALRTQNPLAVGFDGSNYLAVWTEENQTNAQGEGIKPRTLYGSLIAPDGSFISGETALSSNADDQTFPAVQFGGSDYLLAWSDTPSSGISKGILGQFLDRSLNPVGSPFAALANSSASTASIGSGGLLFDGSQFVLTASEAVLKRSGSSISGLSSSKVYGEFIPASLVAPAITTQPVGATNAAGRTAELAVSAEGSALGYQWYKNRVKVAAGPGISGINSAALTLSNGTVAESGTYYVVASNLFAATVSSNAVVSFLSPITLTAAANVRGAGTVTGGGPFLPGAEVTLVATVTNDCHYFSNWTSGGKVVSTAPTNVFIAAKTETVTANFGQYSYNVQTAVSPAKGGTVTGGGSKECGSAVSLKAIAASGFIFAGWTGSLPGTNPALSFTAGGDVAVTAHFRNSVPPKMTVTSPTATVTTSNSTITITGKTSGNVAVAAVYYSNSVAGWVPAQTGNHWSNWMASVPLSLGTNHITLVAVDTNGLDSAEKTVTAIRQYEPSIQAFPIDATDTIKHPQPQIAFDGDNYLVVFQTQLSDSGAPTAQLVSQSGSLAGAQLQIPVSGGADPPLVAFDGTNYLMAWNEIDNQIEGPGIHGQFVSTSGAGLASRFQISQSATVESFGAMVFGGGVYFLLWSDYRSVTNNVGSDDVFGTMLTPAGEVAVSDFEISPSGLLSEAGPGSAAFDGANFLAVWSGALGGTSIQGRLISPAGTFATDPFVIFTNSAHVGTALNCVVFDGTRYLVLFTIESTSGEFASAHIDGRFVTTAGEVLTNQITVTGDTGPQAIPCMAFDGTHFLVTWNQGFNPSSTAALGTIKARFFGSDGIPSTPEFTLFAPQGNKTAVFAPLLFDGTRFFSAAGLGHMVSPTPKLSFTNGVISGAFIIP